MIIARAVPCSTRPRPGRLLVTPVSSRAFGVGGSSSASSQRIWDARINKDSQLVRYLYSRRGTMYPLDVRRRAVLLYDGYWSVRVVARHLKLEFRKSITPQTVARWIRMAGINRPPGARRTVSLPPEFAGLYSEGMTSTQLSARYGVSHSTVLKRLHEAGAKVRPTNSVFAHILTKEKLQKTYREMGGKVKWIADRHGCSTATVYRLLQVHGIERSRWVGSEMSSRSKKSTSSGHEYRVLR